MTDTGSSYGLWLLVFVNSAVFIIFAFSFFKPQTSRDWRSFGAFSAFIIALFTEMQRGGRQPGAIRRRLRPVHRTGTGFHPGFYRCPQWRLPDHLNGN